MTMYEVSTFQFRSVERFDLYSSPCSINVVLETMVPMLFLYLLLFVHKFSIRCGIGLGHTTDQVAVFQSSQPLGHTNPSQQILT